MVFHRLNCVISTKIINDVADDVIQIATLAQNKEELRNSLLRERLKSSNAHSMLSAYDISEMTRTLAKSRTKPEEIVSVLKQINRSLRKHYRYMSGLFKSMR